MNAASLALMAAVTVQLGRAAQMDWPAVALAAVSVVVVGYFVSFAGVASFALGWLVASPENTFATST